jgi:hypothetical protein
LPDLPRNATRTTTLLAILPRDGTDKLHKAQIVSVRPALDDAAVSDAEDAHAANDARFPSWSEASELAFVCAPRAPAAGNLIAFGDQVLNRELDVRERTTENLIEASVAFPASRFARGMSRAMTDVFRRDEFVDNSEVPAIRHLLSNASHQSLVLF